MSEPVRSKYEPMPHPSNEFTGAAVYDPGWREWVSIPVGNAACRACLGCGWIAPRYGGGEWEPCRTCLQTGLRVQAHAIDHDAEWRQLYQYYCPSCPFQWLTMVGFDSHCPRCGYQATYTLHEVLIPNDMLRSSQPASTPIRRSERGFEI